MPASTTSLVDSRRSRRERLARSGRVVMASIARGSRSLIASFSWPPARTIRANVRLKPSEISGEIPRRRIDTDSASSIALRRSRAVAVRRDSRFRTKACIALTSSWISAVPTSINSNLRRHSSSARSRSSDASVASDRTLLAAFCRSGSFSRTRRIRSPSRATRARTRGTSASTSSLRRWIMADISNSSEAIDSSRVEIFFASFSAWAEIRPIICPLTRPRTPADGPPGEGPSQIGITRCSPDLKRRFTEPGKRMLRKPMFPAVVTPRLMIASRARTIVLSSSNSIRINS